MFWKKKAEPMPFKVFMHLHLQTPEQEIRQHIVSQIEYWEKRQEADLCQHIIKLYKEMLTSILIGFMFG